MNAGRVFEVHPFGLYEQVKDASESSLGVLSMGHAQMSRTHTIGHAMQRMEGCNKRRAVRKTCIDEMHADHRSGHAMQRIRSCNKRRVQSIG